MSRLESGQGTGGGGGQQGQGGGGGNQGIGATASQMGQQIRDMGTQVPRQPRKARGRPTGSTGDGDVSWIRMTEAPVSGAVQVPRRRMTPPRAGPFTPQGIPPMAATAPRPARTRPVRRRAGSVKS